VGTVTGARRTYCSAKIRIAARQRDVSQARITAIPCYISHPGLLDSDHSVPSDFLLQHGVGLVAAYKNTDKKPQYGHPYGHPNQRKAAMFMFFQVHAAAG